MGWIDVHHDASLSPYGPTAALSYWGIPVWRVAASLMPVHSADLRLPGLLTTIAGTAYGSADSGEESAMDIGLMVEGQEGLTWERWSHIVALTERLRFRTLYRSDHYFVATPREELDAFLSMVTAAQESQRLRFGIAVTPVTFRRPVDVGRMAAQIDALSGGRFVLGLGAGWYEPEHRAFGVPFPQTSERFDRLDDALALMRTLWTADSATYHGQYYTLEGARLLPKPPPGRPDIMIGGGGEKRTLRTVARYADEWNHYNMTPDAYRAKRAVLERHCAAVQRDPAHIQHTMMVFALIGPTPAAMDEATQRVMGIFPPPHTMSLPEYREWAKTQGMIAGGAGEVVEQLGRLADLGLREVQFQHYHFDRDDLPEYLAADILPQAASL